MDAWFDCLQRREQIIAACAAAIMALILKALRWAVG